MINYILTMNYKKKCGVCRKKYTVVNNFRAYAVCEDCQSKELKGEIKDPEMKKLFDIPEEFFKKNAFLRNIKRNYLVYDKLTKKQIEAFKKTVEDMKK